MAVQTKQQRRAEFALESLQDKVKRDNVEKKLATFIVGMPNMILSNGLGQSLAFLKAKGKGEHNFVFNVIKEYLCKNYEVVFGKPVQDNFQDDFDFLKKFTEISQGDYIKMQDETLRMLEWLKRYARAFEKEEKSSEE